MITPTQALLIQFRTMGRQHQKRIFYKPLRDWRRKWQPTPVLLPGKSHGPRSLVDYSPWGHKELDMTEQLHLTSL